MIRRVAVLAALGSMAACGRSEQARNDEATRQIEKGAQQVQRGAGTMAEGARQGSAEMAEGLQQMAQGLRQMAQESATPVPVESLIALLPEIPGWTRSEPRGESVTAPMAHSRAEARYTTGESRLTLAIADTALSGILTAPLAMFLKSGYAERDGDGFKRATTVAGHPGVEDWNTPSKRGEVTVLVADRFVIKATAHDVPSIDVVRKAVETVDIGKLAALK